MTAPPPGLRSRVRALADAAATILHKWAREDPERRIAQLTLAVNNFARNAAFPPFYFSPLSLVERLERWAMNCHVPVSA